jgi:hypothetical protein
MTDTEPSDLVSALSAALDLATKLDNEPGPVKTGDFMRVFDLAHRTAAAVNRCKKLADGAKNSTKYAAIHKLEAEELDGAPATIDGKSVRFSKYEFRQAKIRNLAEFKAWAEAEDAEAYFDPEPRVREELVTALSKGLEDDGSPLPPGVEMYRETRLSRTAS